MSPVRTRNTLEKEISSRLESIRDPCSVASGVPAGLVSLGLVREVRCEEHSDGTDVRITLCITEPGCLMGAVFEVEVERQVATLPGVRRVDVTVDHGYIGIRST